MLRGDIILYVTLHYIVLLKPNNILSGAVFEYLVCSIANQYFCYQFNLDCSNKCRFQPMVNFPEAINMLVSKYIGNFFWSKRETS